MPACGLPGMAAERADDGHALIVCRQAGQSTKRRSPAERHRQSWPRQGGRAGTSGRSPAWSGTRGGSMSRPLAAPLLDLLVICTLLRSQYRVSHDGLPPLPCSVAPELPGCLDALGLAGVHMLFASPASAWRVGPGPAAVAEGVGRSRQRRQVRRPWRAQGWAGLPRPRWRNWCAVLGHHEVWTFPPARRARRSRDRRMITDSCSAQRLGTRGVVAHHLPVGADRASKPSHRHVSTRSPAGRPASLSSLTTPGTSRRAAGPAPPGRWSQARPERSC